MADDKDPCRVAVLVRVLVRVARSVTIDPLIWPPKMVGTGDRVMVVVPMVILS